MQPYRFVYRYSSDLRYCIENTHFKYYLLSTFKLLLITVNNLYKYKINNYYLKNFLYYLVEDKKKNEFPIYKTISILISYRSIDIAAHHFKLFLSSIIVVLIVKRYYQLTIFVVDKMENVYKTIRIGLFFGKLDYLSNTTEIRTCGYIINYLGNSLYCGQRLQVTTITVRHVN